MSRPLCRPYSELLTRVRCIHTPRQLIAPIRVTLLCPLQLLCCLRLVSLLCHLRCLTCRLPMLCHRLVRQHVPGGLPTCMPLLFWLLLQLLLSVQLWSRVPRWRRRLLLLIFLPWLLLGLLLELLLRPLGLLQPLLWLHLGLLLHLLELLRLLLRPLWLLLRLLRLLLRLLRLPCMLRSVRLQPAVRLGAFSEPA